MKRNTDHEDGRTREASARRGGWIGGLSALAAAVVLPTACVPGVPGGAAGGSQTFSVEYRVSGTADSCTVFYITRQDDVEPQEVNQGGQVIQEDVTLPWTLNFDVTVTPMFPFNTQINAVCTAADVQVEVLVDGVQQDLDQQAGQNVNATAEFTLTVP